MNTLVLWAAVVNRQSSSLAPWQQTRATKKRTCPSHQQAQQQSRRDEEAGRPATLQPHPDPHRPRLLSAVRKALSLLAQIINRSDRIKIKSQVPRYGVCHTSYGKLKGII